MPIFDFRCVKCGHTFEQLVRTTAAPPCPKCKEQTKRLLTVGQLGIIVR